MVKHSLLIEGYQRSGRSYFNKYGEQLQERDGRGCVRCKKTVTLTVDHITDMRYGGEDELHNMQVLCRSCHNKKHMAKTCYFPGCTRTTDYRSTIEREYGITLCDPEAGKGESHFLLFNKSDTPHEWIADNLMKPCVECEEPMEVQRTDYLCKSCRA